MSKSILLLVLIGLSVSASGQRGFLDDFEDGSTSTTVGRDNRNHILWSTESPVTYDLTEQDGILRINYSKQAGIGAYDHFRIVPPRPVNVSANPRIQFTLKSSVDATLTLRPTYSLRPPTYEYLEQHIPGDGTWHTYTFDLYDYLYTKFPVRAVDIYFDRGSGEATAGLIEMDDFKISGFVIQVQDLKATAKGSAVSLTWEVENPLAVNVYQVHRSLQTRFTPDKTTLVGESSNTTFEDPALQPHTFYYYKVIPVDTASTTYFPSEQAAVETFVPGTLPGIQITSINSQEVKKYEKFEALLTLARVSIHNPYDPADIDVYAYFRSPQGDSIRINAFYDNHQGIEQWKLRFSPNLTGNWKYQFFVKDAAGTGKSDFGTLVVVDSEHHGWIRPSKTNSRYFQHDDGTTYYAVGVYSPWRNNEEKINTFAQHDANLLGIWDIGYGGLVNETGVIEEELGRYNDLKLGRLDSLLELLEDRDIKLMYAIWPHDLFSETVWAAEWDKNPYKRITDVVDVYADETAWEYQKRKYRYLIARYAHSRSWGIWELINEMNGTDGWAEARYEDAYTWVQKANEYFRTHDPYRHPVTSSFSGGLGEYRERLYTLNDIPNLHVYPAQGWTPKYPEDSVRSSMYNYAWASQRFWHNFEKPSLFGEAGADLAYFKRTDPRYHEVYHNAIWASLSNGLAGIPVWWQFRHLSDRDWDHLHFLRHFVRDLDLANKPFELAALSSPEADIYGLTTNREAFGWLRALNGKDASGIDLVLEGLADGKYLVVWFDTWSGEIVQETKGTSKGGRLKLSCPRFEEPRPDVAFRIVLD